MSWKEKDINYTKKDHNGKYLWKYIRITILVNTLFNRYTLLPQEWQGKSNKIDFKKNKLINDARSYRYMFNDTTLVISISWIRWFFAVTIILIVSNSGISNLII